MIMLDKKKRKKNQRYQPSEMNVPFTIFSKVDLSDEGRRPKLELSAVHKGLGLAYKPSNKDLALLGTRFEQTSLTLVIPQMNRNIVDTSMVVKINDIRLSRTGYFEIDEVVPDITNGRFMKLIVHKTKQPLGLFEEV